MGTVEPVAAPFPAAEPDRDGAVVRTHRLVRTYGSGGSTIVAVRGLSVAVAARARIALTGPSGSGKSTLLGLLAGLDTPTSGTVSWPGLAGTPAQRVGMVFQGRSLLAGLDVTENVCLPLLLAGCAQADARRRAVEALERVGIAELAGALPDTLSGGQAQRVAVARVLATGPGLILADEPTGQLDHATAAVVISVLMAAADDLGAALIVSTHDPVIARRLPTEWAMRDGRINVPPRPHRKVAR